MYTVRCEQRWIVVYWNQSEKSFHGDHEIVDIRDVLKSPAIDFVGRQETKAEVVHNLDNELTVKYV